jgi:hypothetical protein
MKTPNLFGKVAFAFLALAVCAATARAWHVSGQVLCDENQSGVIDAGDRPVQGVTVVVENRGSTVSATATTGSDGRFTIELPHVSDSYVAYLLGSSIPEGSVVIFPIGGTHSFALDDTNQFFEHANFLIDCAPTPPPPPPGEDDCGKLTGGGWIVTSSGAKANFGVSGGIRGTAFWGHLNYIDHETGMHVRSTDVTAFEQDPANADGRIIRFNVTLNGSAGVAVVRCVDNGEPGRNDLFEITLSTNYTAGGSLAGDRPGGGNIQLHKCPPGWEKAGNAKKKK